MKQKLAEAIELRKNKKPEDAMLILKGLLHSDPNNPDINYQMAWTCDFMGKESEAVPFYEKAIANGLEEGRSGAEDLELSTSSLESTAPLNCWRERS